MHKKLLKYLLLIIVIVQISSCRDKNEQIDYNKNLATAKDIPVAERLFFDLFKLVYKISFDTSLINSGQTMNYGAVIDYFEIPEKRYFVNYGDNYRKCPDKLIRKGYYNVFLTDLLLNNNAQARIEFIDYYVERYKFGGQITITNLGTNSSGGYDFQFKVDTGLLTNKYDSTRTRITHWESDNLIYTSEDDSAANIGLTGTASGISPNGISFTSMVSDTLLSIRSCDWFVSGLQSLNTPSLDIKTGSISYADTSCTNRVYFYFDGLKFYEEIEIR